jgi:predicted N-acetyltransferase YhbS
MTSLLNSERITQRTASGEVDFWLVRQFLLDTWALGPPGFVWDVRRWDGAYFHRAQMGWDEHWHGGAAVGIWEADKSAGADNAAGADGAAGDGAARADRRIVAVAHPEGAGEAWLEVHPHYRWLEEEMLHWAEANLAHAPKPRTGEPAQPGAGQSPSENARSRVTVFASDSDVQRQELLARRGYVQTAGGEHLRRWASADPPQPAPLPAGYRLHTMRPGHPEDCARYAALLNAAFRRTCHGAEEVANFTLHSPSLRADLELIAVAPDGAFAALAGMIYDSANRYGLFEPVCATPAPRPLGLAGWLMHEGVRRVMALGAQDCYVGTGYGMPANRFYAAAGFKVIHSGSYWAKEL